MEAHSKRSLIIIVHEIYGINDHINYYKDFLTTEGFDVQIPDLLNNVSFSYEEEDKAYHFFMNEIGFKKSLQAIKQLVETNRKKYEQIFVLGFSIGATIAWLSTEYKVDGIIGFYGSRIRDYSDIEPQCPILLFFSSNEQTFNVLELTQKLQNKKQIQVKVIEAEHGFMNPFSKNYPSCCGNRKGRTIFAPG